ncbi:LysR family transcriptional regulator [Luteibacter yeojuensis]|uniref:LysR family transcriptional regulator n=1 Tax=Luteibacter yeojuensis TaxID=345309 RepID=A0A7X5QVJ1_9GAMM|nr:LysR family transcriptional regulator [Luteibacter yeojuensis]NID16109.1 LysR family transcriptional regulator [Luteibacter yeojuensis]
MKSLDLDAVRAFVLTAELQSFTRAADALGSTQSAISLKLRRLEAQLGRRLLERTPRQVRLSAEGARFFESARALLEAHEQAVASFETTARRLSIGVSHQLVGSEMPRLLGSLNQYDPHLIVELRVAGSGEVMASYDQGMLDAAIVLQPHDHRRQGEVLFEESFAWVASPHWEPRAGQALPLSTQGETCSIRNAAVQSLDAAGIPWREVFIGKGAALVGVPASMGWAVAVLAKRAAPPGTIDIGHMHSLPALPTQQVVLHSALSDPRSRQTLATLAAAFRSSPAA